jgi:hypothetical protein
MKPLFLLLMLGVLASNPSANLHAGSAPVIPPAETILNTLHPEHPRLLARSNDFHALRLASKTDAQLQSWLAKIQADAQTMIAAPPSHYEIPDGLRLLHVSRRVLHRIYTLALLHQIGGEPKYLERAWSELEAAARFPDWNPRHFLDTAEMTHAFAIGYDWLHHSLTEEQKDILRAAMVEKGIKPALGVYRGTARHPSFHRTQHNWNQVCNGGIGMGALALAGVEPELAREFLHLAMKSLQLPMKHFAPDGAWNEGPGYWNYATTYNAAILAALDSALGTDFGLARLPGFDEAGMFPIYLTGPLGRTFNYADGGDGRIRAPHMFWFARKFNRPVYAAYQRAAASPHALDLLWFDSRQEAAPLSTLPLDRYFREVEVAVFRSAWDDRNALFTGLKAGDNKANHSNLDLGSFILDANGVRWAIDLGADNYNLPGYFGKTRWNFYRMRAEGQNTLVLNPDAAPDQDPAGLARITRYESQPARAFAIADLTPAYARHAKKIERGLAILDRRQVLIQDEVSAKAPSELWWFMHTPAEGVIEDEGRTAILRQGNARLQARILAPEKAVFQMLPALPLPSSPAVEGQSKNAGVRKLAIHFSDVTDVRVAVLLTPLEEESIPAAPELRNLENW